MRATVKAMVNPMRKALLAAACLSLLSAAALADGLKLDGQIEAAQTKSLLAPYTGIVSDYTVRVGDELAAGDTLLALSATPIYADFDGTVTGLFAQAGDSAASVLSRYGALCYMEQTVLYAVDCTTSGADSDNENRIIHVGETVYIRSTSSNERKGTARVIAVDGKSYTLEVTRDQELRLSEQVKVYRSESFTSASCIGTGKLRRIEATPVTGEGYVLGVYVSEGQSVQRGDLLFTLVPDRLDGVQAADGSVTMPEDGIVLSVSAQSGAQAAKDTVLLTYCPKGAVQLVCAADEEDLAELSVGAHVRVTLDAYRDETLQGVVKRIAHAANEESGGVSFDVIIELEENDHVRIGMNATAEL